MGGDRRRALEGRYCCRRLQRGDLTARAAVSARTSRTPPASRVLAHASSVAPVVLTSSTKTTTEPLSASERELVANAPRTLAWRRLAGTPACAAVARIRLRAA